MDYETTTYQDGRGREHTAVYLTWEQVEDVLGEPHDGSPEQDEALVGHLRTDGAPEWVEGAEGFVDEDGWGLIGPERLDAGEVGARIREARKSRGWSQARLAEAVSTDQPYLSRLEAGESEPKATMLRSLATALDISTDYLLGLEGPSTDR